MKDAPQPPFLPFALEQNNINAKREAVKVAQQIGEETQDENNMPKAQTLSKFTVLARLVRVMKQKEIYEAGQELFAPQISEDFHSTKSAVRNAAWKAYRDAVAEAGTPASFATIVQWINENKIRENEAASLIATQVKAIRYPTEQLMNAFFDLATSEKVQKQVYLNQTALQSMASFLRQSQVSNHSAYSYYPTHAFGRFASKNYRIVQRKVIPYLAHKMNLASQNEDSQKMLAYIRALGNLGHPAILTVLEPYLEGKMPTTEFQRLAIVVALDKLTQTYPKIARSVLFKIYQNGADRDEVRAAAVFALMRTNPPAPMLQRMATMTYAEESRNVATAVRSALESAANLDNHEDRELSENAEAARKMLNSDVPAAQDSHTLITDYIMEELNLGYKMQASHIGSDDSLIPKAAFLRTIKMQGGYRNNYNEYYAMVSSVDQLMSMISNRVRASGSSKNKDQDQNKRNAHPSEPNQNKKHNFENIQNLLNIQAEQAEELEAQILMKIAHTQRHFSFNNDSIDNFADTVRRAAKDLAKGQQFNATKWFNQEQLTIAFPLASGLPFLFTYKTPSVYRAGGEIRFQSNPDLAQQKDEQVRAPKNIKATAEIDALYSTQTDARVGFLTLFDHQRYVAGVQKKIQVHLPMRIEMNLDLENDQVSVQVESLEQKKDVTLLHASSWPYTERRDIAQAYDQSKQSDNKVIQTNERKEFNQLYGQQSTGMVFRVNAKYEKDFIDAARVMNYLRRNDFVSLMMYTAALESNEYYNINVDLDNQRSQAQKIKVKLNFNSQRSYEDSENKAKHPKDTSNPKNYAHPQNTDANSNDRLEQFIRNAAAGIQNAEVKAVDASISFEGKNQKTSQYIATVAYADSQSNNQERVLVFASTNPSKDSKKQICLHAETYMPDVPQMNFKNALAKQDSGSMRVELDFGDKCKDGQHVTIKAKMSQSEERKKQVETSDVAKHCKKQMENGDFQMSACRKAIRRANVYDQYTINAEYDNLSSKTKEATYAVYTYLRHLGFNYGNEEALKQEGKSKQVQAKILLAPNMRSANFSLSSPVQTTEWIAVPVSKWVKFLAVRPERSGLQRLADYATEGEYYREF